MNRAYAKIQEVVYSHRPSVTSYTVDVDAKVHEVYGEKKQGAARSYHGVYSFQPLYVCFCLALSTISFSEGGLKQT